MRSLQSGSVRILPKIHLNNNNIMKKATLIFTAALLALTITITGCVTAANPSGVVAVGGVTINPKATSDAVRIAAKLGALAAINKKPELRPYFQAAATAIGVALASGNTTPENLRDCLAGITTDPVALDNLNDAIQLYTDYFGTLVVNKLDSYSPYTVPVLLGLSQGLRQAYDLTDPGVK